MGSLFGHGSETRLLGTLRQLLGEVRRVASALGGFSGIGSTATDTTCKRLSGINGTYVLTWGQVIRSGIGSYDCEVDIGAGKPVVCSALASVLHDTHGVSQSCLPLPGSAVLVSVPVAGLSRQATVRGVILGVLADNGTCGASRDGKSVIKKLADTEFPEGGVAQYTENGPASIAADRKYLGKGEFQRGRPLDLVPGEYALTSHSGAGLVIGALSTEVRGSASASVRCSALDDQVRIASGHFRHLHAAGGEEIYNDNGFVSCESFVTMYQPERLGMKAFNKSAFDWKKVSLQGAQQKTSGVTALKATQTAKKRYYRYAGYLGDIETVFVGNPDPGTETEDMLTDHKPDQGLFHRHVDASGRLTVRSASGILFERYDRIPIPRRRRYAWDPQGDRTTAPEKKQPFIMPKEHQLGIGLTLGDTAAWWNYLSYSRFRQFAEDFTVPGQSEIACPDRIYDVLGLGEEEFEEYDTRHSYMGLLPNGGFVIRDAWGSEIVMANGRITLNAAADIEIRSGSSVVVLGGHDVVLKAHDSLDLSTTDKDVRIKAEGNLQVLSANKGVLIQSQAKADGSVDWTKTGEKLESAGVVIKSDNTAVALLGKTSVVQGTDGVKLAAFDKDGNPSGGVILSGRQVLATAEQNVVATAEGTSGLIVSGQSAVLCAPSVIMAGGQSAGQQAGDKMLIGIPVDAPSMYAQLISTCKSYVRTYIDDTAWLNPVEPENASEISFGFRTTEEYGTDTDSGVAGGVFSVYQPSWAAMAEAQRKPLQDVRTGAWEEKPDADGEFPWPGKAAMQANSYVTYKELNVNKNGLEEPVSHEAQLTPQAFSSYHIRKQD